MKVIPQCGAKTSVFVLAVAWLLPQTAPGQDLELGKKWRGWVDIGGLLGADTTLKEFAGPVSGQQMKLSPGCQLDMGFGYRVTPWLQVGPELGMTFNMVDAFGDFHYPSTSLFQMPIMANVMIEYPYWGRFVPYVGGGVGGVASFLNFGNHWEWEPDGTGSDFVLGFEAFAGVRYRFSNNWSMGAVYRFLATDDQNWDVEWWDGSRFNVGVEGLRLHAFCLVFTGTF